MEKSTGYITGQSTHQIQEQGSNAVESPCLIIYSDEATVAQVSLTESYRHVSSPRRVVITCNDVLCDASGFRLAELFPSIGLQA